KVEVLKELDDGWLEIKPPLGSFNWIEDRSVEVAANQQSATAIGRETPNFIGNGKQEPTSSVESPLRIRPGSPVTIVRTATTIEMRKWWPIEPPPSELRYTPANAVEKRSAVQATLPANPTGAGNTSGASVDPLWQQAEQAQQANDPLQAEKLYYQ